MFWNLNYGPLHEDAWRGVIRWVRIPPFFFTALNRTDCGEAKLQLMDRQILDAADDGATVDLKSLF